MSKRPGAARHREQSSLERAATPPNKGMKQTSVEHIGRSQLIPGVRRTHVGGRRPRGKCGVLSVGVSRRKTKEAGRCDSTKTDSPQRRAPSP